MDLSATKSANHVADSRDSEGDPARTRKRGPDRDGDGEDHLDNEGPPRSRAYTAAYAWAADLDDLVQALPVCSYAIPEDSFHDRLYSVIADYAREHATEIVTILAAPCTVRAVEACLLPVVSRLLDLEEASMPAHDVPGTKKSGEESGPHQSIIDGRLALADLDGVRDQYRNMVESVVDQVLGHLADNDILAINGNLLLGVVEAIRDDPVTTLADPHDFVTSQILFDCLVHPHAQVCRTASMVVARLALDGYCSQADVTDLVSCLLSSNHLDDALAAAELVCVLVELGLVLTNDDWAVLRAHMTTPHHLVRRKLLGIFSPLQRQPLVDASTVAQYARDVTEKLLEDGFAADAIALIPFQPSARAMVATAERILAEEPGATTRIHGTILRFLGTQPFHIDDVDGLLLRSWILDAWEADAASTADPSDADHYVPLWPLEEMVCTLDPASATIPAILDRVIALCAHDLAEVRADERRLLNVLAWLAARSLHGGTSVERRTKQAQQ
ncbi:hypothetical protein AMAG_03619 [Allomyces macrogynus ATCC 38327]|uniref:Uncharacterized protein n=1 Tax=Allomyces macrogynus (strain ATCC 38327) TaxID=578462 RepID=A0A0L0S9P2_ALLM3|nr:hypothetical protein AMAG_03619 [Allomyces macrogynus ATCC 38327]|eukprot:KNE59318.1 hypothetical protein AMAG_03619 [Allomyces macrogynus ATCC 38327]